jgi:hypothetical protein
VSLREVVLDHERCGSSECHANSGCSGLDRMRNTYGVRGSCVTINSVISTQLPRKQGISIHR